MTKAVSRLVVLTLLFVCGGSACAGVDEIVSIYNDTNSKLTDGGATVRYFHPGASGEWVREQSESESFRTSDYRAKAYVSNGNALKVVFETSSQSGDWEILEEYYFYPDGVTAFYFRRIVTFLGYDTDHDRDLPQGPYVVEKRFYYDRKGEEVRALSKSFVSKTKEPVAEKYLQADFPVTIYKKLSLLPFYSLMR